MKRIEKFENEMREFNFCFDVNVTTETVDVNDLTATIEQLDAVIKILPFPKEICGIKISKMRMCKEFGVKITSAGSKLIYAFNPRRLKEILGDVEKIKIETSTPMDAETIYRAQLYAFENYDEAEVKPFLVAAKDRLQARLDFLHEDI